MRWRTPSAVVGDLARLAALVSAVALLLSNQREGGIRFFGVVAVLIVTRQSDISRPFEAAFAVGLTIATWASVAQWYELAGWVDVVVHFFVPGATAATLYLVLARADRLPDLHDGVVGRYRSPVVILCLALGLAVAALWELYEWFAVTYLPSTTIETDYDDTILDLAMGGTGALVAGLLLLWWARSGHGVLRRDEGSSRDREGIGP